MRSGTHAHTQTDEFEFARAVDEHVLYLDVPVHHGHVVDQRQRHGQLLDGHVRAGDVRRADLSRDPAGLARASQRRFIWH